LNEEVYVEQSDEFENSALSNHIFKLHKVFHRLKQAPRAWYEQLSTFSLENDFAHGKIDKTLFIKTKGHDYLIIEVYVNDIVFVATNNARC